MTKIAYIDSPSGVSGDMMLGALIDVGVDLQLLQTGIDSLGLPSCQLVAKEVKKYGFRATKVDVIYEPEYAHRHLSDIKKLIDQSCLTPSQKKLSLAIFTRLAEAEAKVHGSTLDKVHFHEVGAVDSIADIVGAAIGWDLLGIDQITCSPVPVGFGMISIAHGRCSIPAPATSELLQGVPLAESVVEAELTTPTGAAIVTTLTETFGALPPMILRQTGYGAGSYDFEQQANILRLMIGEDVHNATAVQSDQIVVLETNLDDVSGEQIGYCTEKLWQAGAIDLFTIPISMKKQRPAVLLTVLAKPEQQQQLEEVIFRETKTLGIRYHSCQRHILPRKEQVVSTPWGKIVGKEITLPSGAHYFTPEYESAKSIASEHALSLEEVYQSAKEAYLTGKKER